MNTDREGKTELALSGKLAHEALTRRIIGAAMEVHNTLGSGFLEKVYENALVLELRASGLRVEQQRAVSVCYKGQTVGDYVADLLVEDTVVVELKTVEALTAIHKAQLINYLKAGCVRVGLLFNFHAPKLQWERLVV